MVGEDEDELDFLGGEVDEELDIAEGALIGGFLIEGEGGGEESFL